MPLDDSLSFDGDVEGYPGRVDLVIRDDNDLLIYAKRRKNADSEWTIRNFRVLGDGVSFATLSPDRASLAAILVEEFEPDALTTDGRYTSQSPVRNGVPVAVAVDRKPAIAAWLYVRGRERDKITELMDVGDRTVDEYLSRFRRRGTGLPDGLDVPAVGTIVPEVPPEFDPEKS